MTAASTTTLPPSEETLREQLDDAAKHIGRQRGYIQKLEEALGAVHGIWERAENACNRGGFVEDHIITGVAAYTNNPDDARPRDLLCDLVEKLGRKARAVLSGEAK